MQINCPYCNAPLDAQLVATAGQRIRCPRCGDSFPNRWMGGSPPPQVNAPSADALERPERLRRSNRLAAAVVVSLMLTSAAVGLFYALRTTPDRQSRHPDPIKIFAVQDYRPGDLPALGYLPFDTRIAIGIHVADMLREPLGKKLLEKSKLHGLEWVLERIAGWTDLTLENIDHIAVGIDAPREQLPGMVIAVQTRRPYRVAELRKKLTATEQFYERPLFRLPAPPLGDGALWCADDRTLLFIIRIEGVQRADLDRIPFKAHAGMAGLPDGLQELIKTRLPPRPGAWAVGELEGLIEFVKLAPATLPEDRMRLLNGIRRFALGLELQQQPTVFGAIEATDASAAYSLPQSLQAPSLKVAHALPANVLAARCIGVGSSNLGFLTTSALLGPTWVIVQFRDEAILAQQSP